MYKSELTGFARLSLIEQANIIKSITTLVATQSTAYGQTELYELDKLFIEISLTKYRTFTSVKEIRFIYDSEDLKPYLDAIKLPIAHV